MLWIGPDSLGTAATAQMLSWDTDLTVEEQKEYHRLHDKGYRQYQEYGPKTALLHLLMGQDSTTKRFIVIVSTVLVHVFIFNSIW